MDDPNLRGDGITTITRNADASLNGCKDIILAVNIGKTNNKSTEVVRHQSMMASKHITVES